MGPGANLAAGQSIGDFDGGAVDYGVQVGISFDSECWICGWSHPPSGLLRRKTDASSTLILKLLHARLLSCATLIDCVVNFRTHEGLLCFSTRLLVALRRRIGKEMRRALQVSHRVIQHHNCGLHLRYGLLSRG